ncbi:hypothetical protein [Stenotrophomonas sp. PS02289]|uniref:hypothetical protein n=1 Tax=Stenotrophomonas sp. PS02289 TaxID=2991422 RepID=UPI00249BB685|nr:hypothetical protein [Stenotrophomonas sp. PS02289]
MQEAVDRRNEQVYSAFELSRYSDEERRSILLHLKCKGCESSAHFRRESEPSGNRKPTIPHFYCRPHAPNCDIASRNGDPWETNEGDETVRQWQEAKQTLIVRIQVPRGEESQSTTTTEEASGDTGTNGGGGGRQKGQAGPLSRGPQRLLEQLLHWPSFKTSALPMRMPDNTTVPVHDGFVGFEHANVELHTGRWLGFWGLVQPLKYWAYGESYYSNFGTDNSSFRISIHKSKVQAILDRYRLDSVHDLVGNYVLLFDLARESNSGRFTADINSVHYMGFLRA